MFVSFSKRLKWMGGVRIGGGMKLNAKNALILLFVFGFIGMFYLFWWTVILCGWFLYWFCWLWYAAIRGIVRAVNKSKKKKLQAAKQANK